MLFTLEELVFQHCTINYRHFHIQTEYFVLSSRADRFYPADGVLHLCYTFVTLMSFHRGTFEFWHSLARNPEAKPSLPMNSICGRAWKLISLLLIFLLLG